MSAKNFLKTLSGKQRAALIASILVAIIVVVAGLALQGSWPLTPPDGLTGEMTVRELARATDRNPREVASEFGLPRRGSRNVPLSALGIDDERIASGLKDVTRARNLKLYMYLAIVIFGIAYLALWGRPDRSSLDERSSWYPRAPYLAALVVSVATGFWLGRLPNPMGSVTRLYKGFAGFYPSFIPYAALFLFFIALAVIGNKVICGWACPLGALQEIIFSIPGVKRLAKLRPPFWLTNSIRVILFALMMIIPIGALGGRGSTIYRYLNAFNLFDMRAPAATVLLVIAATIILSPFLYRPFCRIICPFGLVSWLTEKLSVLRVRIDHDVCTKCGECIKACPLGAAKGLVEKKALPEDCFSCARCLNRCPVDAIKYGFVFRRP